MPDFTVGNLIDILYFNFGVEFVRLWQIILNGYLLRLLLGISPAYEVTYGCSVSNQSWQ